MGVKYQVRHEVSKEEIENYNNFIGNDDPTHTKIERLARDLLE